MKFTHTEFNPHDNTVATNNVNFEPLVLDLDQISIKKQEFEQLKQQLINEFRIYFESMAKEIFSYIPQLKAISWTQYSPYFNDGDECKFSIRDIIYYNFIPKDGFFSYAEEIDEDQYPKHCKAFDKYNLHTSDFSKEAIEFLTTFELTIHQHPEFIEEIFDDNSKICLTADGIVVEDYSQHH